MPFESSMLYRVCLVWFAGYYTVGGLPSAHKVLTGRAKAVTKVVEVKVHLGFQKNVHFLINILF